MALILFVIGGMLYFRKKLRLGVYRTEGRHVRLAGAVLMMPLIGAFFLAMITGFLFARNIDALWTALSVLSLLEFGAVLLACGIAYILLFNPENAPRLPGVLGDVQAERRGESGFSRQDADTSATTPAGQHPISDAAPVEVSRDTFPKVLTVSEAAAYLRVSDADIMAMIESGKLAAARINYEYRIARTVLDDLLGETTTT